MNKLILLIGLIIIHIAFGAFMYEMISDLSNPFWKGNPPMGLYVFIFSTALFYIFIMLVLIQNKVWKW